MVFQGKRSRKLYKAIMWVIIILVIISFMFTIVYPLMAASAVESVSVNQASLKEGSLPATMVGWLTRPWISWFLVAAGMSGLALEFFSISWGRPGTAGIISLALFFLGSFLSGTADVWEVALFVLGVFLIVLELVFLSGRLVAGLTGAVMLFAGIVLASPSTVLAAVYLSVGLISAVFLLLCSFKIIDLKAIWERIRHGKPSNRPAH